MLITKGLRVGATAGVAFGILAFAAPAFAGLATFEVLFKSSDLVIPPPGFPAGGVVWNSASTFSNLSIADDGTVAFVGKIFDNDLDNPPLILAGGSGVMGNDRVLYYGTPGNWTNVAESGVPDPLPGGPAGFTFNTTTGGNGLNTSTVAISPNGNIVASGTINYVGVTAATDTAMWNGTPGSMSFIVQEGSHAGSETGDVNYSSSLSISSPRLNNARQYIFHSNLTGADTALPSTGVTGTNMGVFIASPSGVSTFARRGSPAPAHPGLPADTLLNTQDTFGLFINGNGYGAYGCRLSNDVNPSAITTSDDRCILTNIGGSLQIALRENDEVPGMPGVHWAPNPTSSPFNPAVQSLNNSNQFLFNSMLAGTGITAENDYGVFVLNADGSVTTVFREGDTLPGLSGDTLKFVNNTNFGFNNTGYFAGAAALVASATNDEVVLAGPAGGALTVVVREGDPVPGLTDVFFGTFISNSSTIVNDANQVLFSADLTGAGTTLDNNNALFEWDETNGLTMLLRKGDTTVLGGDAITIIAVASTIRNGEGGSCAFTDTGWIAMNLYYSGGSAIVRANLASAPACPTDITGDGSTGGADLAIVLGAWGPNPGSPADLNGDGNVGGDDLAILLGGWGPC